MATRNAKIQQQLLKDSVLEIKSGVTLTRFRAEDGKGKAVKVLSIRDINQESIYLPDDVGDTTEVTKAAPLEKFLLKDGDVVISTKGSAIKVATFRGKKDIVANGNLSIIRCGEELLPEYLTIFLKSARAVHALQLRSKGSAILNLTTSDIGSLEIPIPSIEDQEKLIQIHLELETYTSSRLAEVELVKKTVTQKTEQLIYK